MMNIGPLAHNLMISVAENNVQAGEVLPEKSFDLFLTQDDVGDALMELYSEGLLEEVPHEVDILTQKGFEYTEYIRQQMSAVDA
ncbi:hypothetical protein DLP14_14485 [Salmonella enterica]|nr:hypothetical protein [Salmonella enterica]EMD7797608.1 hypothetical protein [Salmonella enterica]